jgi:hypothetical protein
VEEVKIVANSAILTVQGSAIPKCPQMLLNALRVIDTHFLFFVFFSVFHRFAPDPASAGGSRNPRSCFQI